MICARNQTDMPGENGDSGEFPVSSLGESETFASNVRHSPAKKAATNRKRKPAAKAKPGTERELSDIERHEREIVEEMRQRLRSARCPLFLHPRKKEDRPAASETFTAEVRHDVPPAAAAVASEPTASEPTSSDPAAETTAELTPRLLHDKQSLALTALLRGQSVVDAAQAAGVNRRTVHRWLQQPDFQAELHRLQSCFCTSLRTTAAELTDESVKVIEEMLGRGGLNTALNLLKSIDILNGQPLTTIDGLHTDTQPDPAVVFPPPQPAASPAETTSTTAESESISTAASSSIPASQSAKPVSPPTTLPLTIDDLPPQQQVVITALVQGKLVPAAAELAGVTVSKVLRWKKSDTAFRQVLIACRQEQHRQLRAKLLNMGIRSLDILRLALKKYRNVRVAFAILKGVGVLSSQQ